MTANLYDIANELERAIRQLPAYKAVEEMKEIIAQHPESKAVLEEYVAFQKTIQGQLQAGEMPSADAQQTMQEFTTRIQEHPVLLDYFSKQQALATYVTDLERIIFQPLNELLG